jgi:hypothetical protein
MMTFRAVLRCARLAVLVGAVLGSAMGSAGCSKTGGDQSTPSATSTTVAPPASGSASAPAPSASARDASAATAWRGTYKSAAGTVTIPESLKAGSWKNADTNVGLGEGSLTLVVDPTTDRVSGHIDGALGPATITGLWSAAKVTATIRRDDPADQGFTGMLEATPVGAELQGTMNGALGNVNAVRTASFTLSGGTVPTGDR